MSAGVSCSCVKRLEPDFREKFWRVTCYHGNFSAFNGYRFTPSDYSEVSCLQCGGRWRTKAQYVEALRHA